MTLNHLRKLLVTCIAGISAFVCGADQQQRIAATPNLETPQINLEPVLASGLSQPVFITNSHDGSNRLFFVEQPGMIKVLRPGKTTATVFLDIISRVLSGGEQGLLGLAFHPQYPADKRFYVNYTRKADGATVIAEYRASAGNPDTADTAENILLIIPQPYSNHNGGMVAFGPDGFLYIGMGDGGSGNDPENRAQNPQELLGKMLRIDINRSEGGKPYAIPPSNPYFNSTAGRPEIFALGLRNPWRFSFDRQTGDLYAGDVGQNVIEEVDIIKVGGNYGWRVLEGTRCTGLGPASCTASGFIPPIAEYAHQLARCSITGGYVYRGNRATLPLGAYVYGDYCSGEIFMLQGGTQTLLTKTTLNISSFGEDEAGEIYVAGHGGAVYRIVNPNAAERLSVGLGRFAADGGWIGAYTGSGAGFAFTNWIQLPWLSYDITGGPVHVAVGDVDGDGLDEMAIGLGSGGGGWIAILDDAAHDYALLKWIRVQWDDYGLSSGEVFPAVADIDGDGRAEIVAGLGAGGQGWIEIFDDAANSYQHLAWRQLAWPFYNVGNGVIHPAAADLDGDGEAEIILGLGMGGGGWMEVLSGARGSYAHKAWIRVDWPDYDASNGSTFPAAGDLDGDGRAEIVVGLGQGGAGWFEVLDDATVGYTPLKWLQLPSQDYNSLNGETHPAVGDLDFDARAEIILGLGKFPGNGGRLYAFGDAVTNYAPLGSLQLNWKAFIQDGGETYPAIGRLR